MPSLVKMVVVLTGITTLCGVALGGLNAVTKERIEEQDLRNKQLPAVEKVFSEATNDLLADRRKVALSKGDQRWLFVARREAGAEPYGASFEAKAPGFEGSVGVMVGFDLTKNVLAGVAVTTHSETPGVGARAATEPGFCAQFAGMPLDASFRVRQDGGEIDAISGASITSRAVAQAVSDAVKTYQAQREVIAETALRQGEGGAE